MADTPDPPAPERTRWAVSLLTMLAATTLAAIAAAPVTWLGPNYVASAFISLVLLVAVSCILIFRNTALVLLPCLLMLVASLLFFSSGLFWQAVGTAVVCLATAGVSTRVGLRVSACALVMIVAYLPMIRGAMVSDRRIDQMREAWPLISLRERLPEAALSHELNPVTLSPEQTRRLVERDSVSDRSRGLIFDLRRLHSDEYKRFARAPGFGFMRMGPVTAERLVRHDSDRRNDLRSLPTNLQADANEAKPADLHREAEGVFLDTDRIGYAQDIDHVAGFQGHGFDRLPYETRWSKQEDARAGNWTLHRLDLIGLVLNEVPVAYVSASLPNMDELRDVPTRELDSFESKAVERLRGAEDLVVDEEVEEGMRRVAMVGAIRAGKSCQTCHEVPYGTLLGAFSYDLTQLGDEP